ncbi:MAG: ribulose-phosphate 3-epimerase, partial [Clostridia bacterium]|nr:ribulose-phosphate 3-epimerase [Clostridia bacterium]
QKFIEGVLDKVEEIYKIADKSEKIIELEIDGGVNLNNCTKIKDSGVNVLVAGNTVFSAADRKEVIEKLRNE